MTYRCLELLDLPASEEAMVDDDDEEDDEEEDRVRARPSYLLDIGAGSGLSGEILTEEGHQWVGMDVSGGMLGQSLASLRPYNPKLTPSFPTEVALEREVEGDLMLADIGQGIPFRPGAFDGAIS